MFASVATDGTDMDAAGLTLDELGDEITTLAAHINAATCRWLQLIGEFDARSGWAEWGCLSCAHWISWRCSISPGAAREHVRVARRLRDLPLVTATFAAGELSYSQARALTRIEDVEQEASLVELARHSTAAQLEKIVRAYRGVALEAAERTHELRHLDISYAEDGAMVLRGRLPAEDGALVLRALELIRDRRPAVGVPAETRGGDVSAEARGDVPAETRGDDVPAETSGDVGDGADAAAGVEPPTFGARTADALVELADRMLAAGIDDDGTERTGGDRFQVVVHVDAGALADEPDGRAEVEGAGPVSAETARRLCCDAALVRLTEQEGAPLSVGRKTRSIPPALRRAMRARDGGCRFPGCQQHRWVDAHHIEHWAHGGETSLENLVTLCRHHHHLLHEGGFRVDRGSGGDPVFRRADGRRLRPTPRPRRGDPGCLRAQDRREGRRMTPDTPVPHWWGDRLDLPAAVDAVLAAAPPSAAPPSAASPSEATFSPAASPPPAVPA